MNPRFQNFIHALENLKGSTRYPNSGCGSIHKMIYRQADLQQCLRDVAHDNLFDIERASSQEQEKIERVFMKVLSNSTGDPVPIVLTPMLMSVIVDDLVNTTSGQ
jgi:hypothetical protein